MKTKSFSRLICALLSVLMVVAAVPFTGIGVTARADDTAGASSSVYVLDAAADLQAAEQGSFTDGQSAQAGTNKYFTVYFSAKTKIDGSNKTFDDGYSSGQRLNLGGKLDAATPKNGVFFETKAAAVVKVWWVEGGEDNRQMVITDVNGAEKAKTAETLAKNDPCLSTLKLDAAGKYFLGGDINNNYIFKVEVTEQAASKEFVLDAAADLKAADAGTYTDGQAVKAGADDFFTIYFSAKSKIDSSEKTFDDGFTSKQRINLGGKLDAATPKNGVYFETNAPATVKVWWVEGGDDNRQIVITDASGAEKAKTAETLEKNKPCLSTLKLDGAGKYFLGGDTGNNYLFKIQVTEEAAAKEYALDALKDVAAFAQGSKKDGESVKAGTEDFFTIYCSEKTKVDGSEKTFDDGFSSTQRINFGGKLDAKTPKNGVFFETSAPATVKVWWVEGGDDNRQIVITDASGTEKAKTAETLAKNGLCISTLTLSEAGKYFLGGDTGSNYIFKITVTTGGGTVVRGDWSKTEAPAIKDAAQSEGSINVTATAVVGVDGGDKLVVTMTDKDGNETALNSLKEDTTEHTFTFNPTASGKYTFKAALVRDGEEDKVSESKTVDYVLPLGVTTISSATSKGDGKIEVVWNAVAEATGYEIYRGKKLVGTTDKTSYMVEKLTVGKEYSFTVAAVRGDEKGKKSEKITAKATKESQNTWGFTIYGPSTDTEHNGYVGSVNEDGKVTVYSEGGKGKINQGSTDGVAFYYTPIPATQNFTLRANVHVDSWTYSNGQDGFGLMALDSLPNFREPTFWTNDYMAVVSKMEYWWDTEKNDVSLDKLGNKYSMVLGVGVNTKLGITPENKALVDAGTDAALIKEICGMQYPLDVSAATSGMGAGSYNIAGNVTNADALAAKSNSLKSTLTDFVLEIRKNNTGYFISYYDKDGKLIRTQKFYDPDALEQLDKDYVYAGFFAARNARATFSDIKLTTVDPKDDDPAEERPITKIAPRLTVKTADVANSEDYTLKMSANVAGTVTVSFKGLEKDQTIELKADSVASLALKLAAGKNNITLTFTPDPDQKLGEFEALESTDPVTVKHTVTFTNKYSSLKKIYVSPDGTAKGKGTKKSPLDIYTAVRVAQPGQSIILTEGVYKLTRTVRIERGIDGTKDKLIEMKADTAAKSRPVLDFQKACQGITAGGNYWYFKGFDVCNSINKQAGFAVCGNDCVLDEINAYNNGDSGIYIHALHNSNDAREDWPKNNLILNCTAHNNFDSGYEDADGFAAKLTIGEGNVFDGCVSYNNADDGWDLYARVSSGSIGAVTIKNCVAFNNGYLEDGTVAGNGNGFKMGGENLAGGHKIINSVSFNNKADGITSNSCPDVKVENCTVYNNEGANLNLYTNNKSNNTDFEVKGLVSYKDNSIKSGLDKADSVKAQGTQDNTKYQGDSNYFWSGSKGVNASGAKVIPEMFKSLRFVGVNRDSKGGVDLCGFLELSDKAPENAGAGLKSSSMSGTAYVTLGEKTTVPAATVNGKANVRVDASHIWMIDGKGGSLTGDVDLGINFKPEIPDSALTDIKGTKTKLHVNGADTFGFQAQLLTALGKANGGKAVELYKYEDSKLTLVTTAAIADDGYAVLNFERGGDYVMVIRDDLIGGDVDGDGKLSALDAVKLLKYSTGLETMTNTSMGDINADGAANAMDAVIILQKTVGLL